MTNQPAQNSTAAPFGPNVKAFLDKALPANKGGHVLAIAEHHDAVDYRSLLQSRLPHLTAKDGHNVGVIGFELPIYMNALFMAHRDGKLPVKQENADAYTAQIIRALTHRDFRGLSDKLVSVLLKNDEVNVVAFDSRERFLTTIPGYHLVLHALDLGKDRRDELRGNQNLLNLWATIEAQRLGVGSVDNTISPADAVKAVWARSEIYEILRNSPNYVSEIAKMNDIVRNAESRGLGFDGQSAAVLASYAKTDKNTISISGASHIVGMASAYRRVEGNFAAHLALSGLEVAPVFMSSRSQISDIINDVASPELLSRRNTHCAARSPISLVVLDSDVVLDASNNSALQAALVMQDANQSATEIASGLLARGAKLTCDRPELPTVAECAKQEVEGKGACRPPRR
jgi:hypothetical protein